MKEINVKGVDQDSRIRVLKLIRDRYGYRKACRILNISQSSMYRYLNGKRLIPDNLLNKMLEYIDRVSFMKYCRVVKSSGSWDLLEMMGA